MAVYFLLTVILLESFVSIPVYTLNKHKNSDQSGPAGQSGKLPSSGALHNDGGTSDLIGCDRIEVEDVWVQGIPKLLTESAFRLVDVNQDGVLDVIMGFMTGTESSNLPQVVCDIYFNGTDPCRGGLMALEGLTGRELWRHYSRHELFGVNCNVDIDQDGVLDCLGGGRAAAFEAVSGKEGKLLWTFQNVDAKRRMSNFYTPQYIDDIDGDHVPDILAIHGGDPIAKPYSETREAGRILLVSGATGQIIRWMSVPGKTESYYSPQVYFQVDGTKVVLFGTGGETHKGALYAITLQHLLQGKIEMARAIYTDNFKGVQTPPVLVDLTGDGVVDIVINPFNSTVVAIDGNTYSVIWNWTFPMSETYSTPGAGYYNDDDIPDFMVQFSFGPGFPMYYHAEVNIIDGKNGKPLLDHGIRSSLGAQSSQLSVSMEGKGHDLFLYWIGDCQGHEAEGGEFRFVNGTNVHKKSRWDPCKLRYKSKMFSKFLAVSSSIKPPGALIYYSEERIRQEHDSWVNTSALAEEYLRKHPDARLKAKQHNRKMRPKQHSSRFSKEDYLQGASLPKGQHSPGAKKGPSLQPQDDNHATRSRSSPTKKPSNNLSRQNETPHLNSDRGRQTLNKTPDNRRRQNVKEHPQPYNNNSGSKKRGGWSEERSLPQAMKKRRRKKRHVGPHDDSGFQRLLSTGMIAPPTLAKDHPDYGHSMDVVFATYWIFPAKNKTLLTEDEKCVDKMMGEEAQRFDPGNKYYGLDHDAYGHVAEDECAAKSHHQMNDDGVYESQSTFDAFNLHMGQMTVYRLRLKCTCSQVTNTTTDKRCAKMLPFENQHWPAYMGKKGDSHWFQAT
ncbi:hypothetical protein V1264_017053 [Littorina saxatilis]|uniref:FAM234A/B beta-propeller domain-containing protein n=2 Tax=Littorina saxatilis TaxID=31220 RepID=A0AAN9GFC9_9CAEN